MCGKLEHEEMSRTVGEKEVCVGGGGGGGGRRLKFPANKVIREVVCTLM